MAARRHQDTPGQAQLNTLDLAENFKRLGDAHRPSVRGWQKYKVRETRETIVSAVTGSPAVPRTLLLGANGLWTPSGNLYYGSSQFRSPSETRELPLVPRRVVNQLGHHGGCAEIGCITQALNSGELIRRSRSLAMVHKPFDNPANRRLAPGRPACQQLMNRLNITNT
ncbi:hypothetical protein OG496_02075 [Streptomyces sp. NBC_00988]|uniref:hypothetical protein n=1 Tax=Streptomyces sp. NBC_00988 TaxID=2903704 RepID=UPI0038680E2A|nr:hypothetical protein OG496_02075 [Streptomyces sp. NBC_00988]